MLNIKNIKHIKALKVTALSPVKNIPIKIKISKTYIKFLNLNDIFFSIKMMFQKFITNKKNKNDMSKYYGMYS